MSIRRVRGGLCMVLVLAASGYLKAADFTVFVGGVKPGKLNRSGILTSLDSSPVFGARMSTNFVPAFGLEYTVAFSSDYLFPHNTPGVTDTKGFVGNVNLIVNIPLRVVTPYATAGVGLIHQYGSGDPPVGTKFAFNYGGGLKFPKVIGPLGLRFDARGYTAVAVFSSKLNILEVSGGLFFRILRTGRSKHPNGNVKSTTRIPETCQRQSRPTRRGSCPGRRSDGRIRDSAGDLDPR
jgi:hypothetical protein